MKNIKTYCLFFVILLFFASCNIADSEDIKENEIITSFFITDTNGVEKKTFKKDENFILSFKVINRSKLVYHYTYTPPLIIYSILNADSVVSRSTDYMGYAQPIVNGKLNPNEELIDSWIGPFSEGRLVHNPMLELSEGTHIAVVHHNVLFDERKISQTKNIEFKIIK